MSGDPFWKVIEAQNLDVAPAVAALHKGIGERHFTGRATITRGKHPLVRFALWSSGFPPAGADVDVTLTLVATENCADWKRNFGGHITRSRLWFDARKLAVKEKLGPFVLTMDLQANEGQLFIGVAGFSAFGIPMPKWLHPVSTTRERQDEIGRFCFDVSGRMPGFGLIIRYEGHLEPTDRQAV